MSIGHFLKTAALLSLVAATIIHPSAHAAPSPKVPEAPFKRAWTNGPVLLLGLGDSITEGFAATKGFSYFERLVTNPPGDNQDMKGRTLSAAIPNLTVRNLAKSCTTSADHMQEVQNLPTNQPNLFGIVVMTTGGNDIIHNYGKTPPKECAMYGATYARARPWIESFEKRLNAMLVRIKESFPGGCRIFLANIYDPTDGTGDPRDTGLPPWTDALAILNAYNSAIESCARKHDFVSLVDIHTVFKGHGITATRSWQEHTMSPDPDCWYAPILEDPNDLGYDVIRRVFLLEMIEALAASD